ncbi:hypothetical protein Btru_025380 [Bulinus truncatus]|nr:hypothetical protein Btru_025380 [Bulinus truncatus]
MKIESGNSDFYFNITVHDNAEPKSAQKSAIFSINMYVSNGSVPNIDFQYPSCIQSLKPQHKKCILPRYSTSLISNDVSAYLMSISTAIPVGYQSMFKVKTVKVGANVYKCQVTKVANKSLNITKIRNLQIFIMAFEPRLQEDFADIYLTVKERSPPVISLNGSVGYIYVNSSGGDYVLSDSIRKIPYRLLFIDPDATLSSPATLFNVSVDPKSPFIVNGQGYITLKNSTLDQESVRQYKLIVTVWKAGASQLSANATLTINVLDPNSSKTFNS